MLSGTDSIFRLLPMTISNGYRRLVHSIKKSREHGINSSIVEQREGFGTSSQRLLLNQNKENLLKAWWSFDLLTSGTQLLIWMISPLVFKVLLISGSR